MMKVKEDKLRGRYRDTYTALMWLRKNRDRFEGNVHEPMMLVVRAQRLIPSLFSGHGCSSRLVISQFVFLPDKCP